MTKQKAVYTHICACMHACAVHLCPSRGTYQSSLEVPAFWNLLEVGLLQVIRGLQLCSLSSTFLHGPHFFREHVNPNGSFSAGHCFPKYRRTAEVMERIQESLPIT